MGCGGRGANIQTDSTSRLSFDIEWPTPSRFVHQSATHIVVSAKVNQVPIALTATTPDSDPDPNLLKIDRPDPNLSITSSQVAMTGLPSGPVTFTVESFRTGVATALGKAIVPVVLTPGDNPNLIFNLNSQTTQVKLVLNPQAPTYSVGQAVQATAIAMHGSTEISLGANAFSFSSSNLAVATIDNAGLIHFLTPGETTITAREAGNDTIGVSGTVVLTCGQPASRRYVASVISVGVPGYVPIGILEDGTVVGNKDIWISGNQTSYRNQKVATFRDGIFTEIAFPPGYGDMSVNGASGSYMACVGRPTGGSFYPVHGFIYSNAGWQRVPDRNGYALTGVNAVNDQGKALVGYDGIEGGSGLMRVDGLWNGIQFEPFSGFVGRSVNTRGLVAGVSTDSLRVPTTFLDGTYQSYGLPVGSLEGEFVSVSPSGRMSYISRAGSSDKWWLFENGLFTSLGSEVQGFEVVRITDRGEALAYFQNIFDAGASVRLRHQGNWVDVETLVQGSLNFEIVGAIDMNEAGQLVCIARPKDSSLSASNMTYLFLDPVP